MVWLAKWVRENIPHSRVIIITDRTELDDQIEKVFTGVNERIYRASRGGALFDELNKTTESLLCSLIHKFGSSDKTDTEAFIEDIKRTLPEGFSPKGEMFVFIDECHRTQFGETHKRIKKFFTNHQMFGFTGTPIFAENAVKNQLGKRTTAELP